MVSFEEYKDDEPMKDLEELKLEEDKEEVKSEEEEGEQEGPRVPPRVTIASIGVMPTPLNPRGARMSTGGKVPRHPLAPRTPASNRNTFYHFIHKYQYQKIPRSELPSLWDIDRSNHAEKESSDSEDGWNKSKDWDSKYDKLANRVEHNSSLLYNLLDKVDELKELAEKLVKDSSSPPPKE